jgi:hypothetical protein
MIAPTFGGLRRCACERPVPTLNVYAGREASDGGPEDGHKLEARTLPDSISHFSAPVTPVFIPLPGSYPVTFASAS